MDWQRKRNPIKVATLSVGSNIHENGDAKALGGFKKEKEKKKEVLPKIVMS